MGITKELEECPFDGETRQEQIQTALDAVPDMSPEDLASFATKMNLAIISGNMPMLSAQEQTSLRTLSNKCIPEAPKQLNINAQVKSENVILHWLEDNRDNFKKTEARVIEQSALEIEQLASLDDFANQFRDGDEDR